MRHAASVVVFASLGGCSLIYNPGNIPTQQDGAPDAPFDAPIDSDPTMITVTGVRPLAISEGQGANGSRPAVIVIQGTNFVKSNTTVTIAPSAPVTKTPMMIVDNSKLDVSADGFFITVPISLPVDQRPQPTGLKDGDMIALDITVMQDAPGGAVMKTLPGMLKVVGLDELTTGGAIAGGDEHVYSLVDVTTAISAVANSTMPIIIRSTSSLSIKAFDVSGSAQMGGPEGGTGGSSGSVLVAATPGTGPAPGQVSGGAGGFAVDPTVYTLGDIFRSSGGAGATAALGGGNGGGGGGTIMLVAGGNLSTAAGTSTGGAPTGNGGGGSGGVIVLRAGGSITTTGAMNLTGTGMGAAMGAPGKLRYDAGGTVSLMGSPTGFRGPQFVDAPLVVNAEAPMLQIVAKPQAVIKYYITNAAGTVTSNAYTVTVPDTGPGTVVNGVDAQDRLSEGLNRVCLVAGAGDLMSKTRNCIDVAYIGH